MRIIGLIVFLLVFAGLDYYLYRIIRVNFLGKPTAMTIFTVVWFIIPVVCVLLGFFAPYMNRTSRLLATNIAGIIFFSIFITAALVFVGDVVRLVANAISKPPTEAVSLSRRKMLSNLGLVMLTIPMASMFYGLFKTAYNFKIHRITLKFPNLPKAFHGFRFVQISDIHTGSFVQSDELDEAISIVLNEKADTIFFTGDLVNNKTEEAYQFKESLARLKAPYGVFSILGNHDYGDYARWESDEAKVKNLHDMIELQEKLGWNLLNNHHRILEKNGEKIAIVGVENYGAALRFPKKGDVDKAKKGTEDVPFKILLSHDPSHWDAKVVPEHKDMDLMLAGHTHGFQFGVEIPGIKWSPSQWIYKQWAGLYQKGSQYLYVNRGLGCIGYSGRIGIRPEITVIELEKA